MPPFTCIPLHLLNQYLSFGVVMGIEFVRYGVHVEYNGESEDTHDEGRDNEWNFRGIVLNVGNSPESLQ